MVLTGSAAVESVQLYMKLGAAGARFNRHRVSVAVRTSWGRARLASLLSKLKPLRGSVRARGRAVAARSRRCVSARHGGAQRASAAPDRPARPSGWIYVGTPDGPPFENGCRNA